MQLRIFTEPQQGASYRALARVARAAEDLGFDAFFRSDHFLQMEGQFARAGAERIYLQMLDLTDIDHLELIASQVLPQVC